jgi:hypothetical protein
MMVPDKKWWALARRARDKLAQLVGDDPAISLIDIGKDETRESDSPVLRVHVRTGTTPSLDIPDNVNGIPVRVISGGYELEQ